MHPAELDLWFKGLELLVWVMGGLGIIYKLGGAVKQFEIVGKQQSKEISELKTEIKGLGEVLVQQAVQSSRMDNLRESVSLLDRKVDAIQMALWGPGSAIDPKRVAQVGGK